MMVKIISFFFFINLDFNLLKNVFYNFILSFVSYWCVIFIKKDVCIFINIYFINFIGYIFF